MKHIQLFEEFKESLDYMIIEKNNVKIHFFDNSYQYASTTDNVSLPSNLKNVNDYKKLENFIKDHLNDENSWAEIYIGGKQVARYSPERGGFYMNENFDVNTDD